MYNNLASTLSTRFSPLLVVLNVHLLCLYCIWHDAVYIYLRHRRISQRFYENELGMVSSSEFSKVLPIEGGEIFVPLTQGRPSENDIQV